MKMKLPGHMTPAAYVVLERFPLTPNGKVDRKALPSPDAAALGVAEYEPPQSEMEQTLASIWVELPHLERVGRRDNFFALGGHSLLIVQLIEHLRQVGVRASVRQVFDGETLSALAATLSAVEKSLSGRRRPNSTEL